MKFSSLSLLLKLLIILPLSAWADCGFKNEKRVISRDRDGYTAVWTLKADSKWQAPLSDPRERHHAYATWVRSKTGFSARELLANHLMILNKELSGSSDLSNLFEQVLGREQRNVNLVLSGQAVNIRPMNCLEGLVFNEFLKVVDLRHKPEEFFSSWMIKGPEIQVIADFYGDSGNLRGGGAGESTAASIYRNRLLREGWILYASYHNHPFSFDNSYGDVGGNLAPSEADISLYRERRPLYALIANGIDTVELTEKDYLAFERQDRQEQIKQIVESFDEKALRAGVRIKPDPSFKGLAGSYQIRPGSFLVLYNPKIFNSLAESARFVRDICLFETQRGA